MSLSKINQKKSKTKFCWWIFKFEGHFFLFDTFYCTIINSLFNKMKINILLKKTNLFFHYYYYYNYLFSPSSPRPFFLPHNMINV